ncbi:MAG TPA: hypothetical protein VNV63_00390 [Nitrospiria bacterium]|jgi:hypothetical protein|nr:hypothetical protein [Nitrospiria bacterium]
MGKLIGVILILAIGFGAGYYVGTNRMVKLRKDVEKLKVEMEDKVARFEQQLTNLRHRDHLIVAKDKLHEAQRDLTERNFGDAQRAIQNAQEEIREAEKLAGPSEKEKYSALSAGLNEISNDLTHPTRPQFREKIQRAAKDLDQLAGK